MKKTTILLVTMLFLLLIAVSVQAADENAFKGDFTGLAGDKGLVNLNYQFTDKLNATVNYEDDVYIAGFHYQPGEMFGIKAGERYEAKSEETIPYGGINILTPFGTGNLRLYGKYDYNFRGKDWNDYEAALRIEMYKNQFLYAGVQGSKGDGVIHYDYNINDDPLFFLRGDFNWQWKKFEVNLQPLLFVTGYVLYDANIKYNFNERTSLVFNSNSYDDQIPKYRLGIEYKF